MNTGDSIDTYIVIRALESVDMIMLLRHYKAQIGSPMNDELEGRIRDMLKTLVKMYEDEIAEESQ